MERDSEYESFLVNTTDNNGGPGEFVRDYSSSDETATAAATFNAMFSGVSLLSLLTATTASFGEPSPPPLMPTNMPRLFGDPFSPPASLGVDLAGLSFLKSPKPEPPHPSPFAPNLPDLLSLELPQPQPQPRPGDKRARAEPWAEAHRRTFRFPELAPEVSPPVALPEAMVPRNSALQRKRRQRLSEKTRCLQRVLPWDTKMDMATMLEETYKYVKFLQAQLSALSTMPEAGGAGASFAAVAGDDEGVFEGLGRLSRNQLLQVLVNSPVAQTILYSKGCCIFSLEQLGLIGKVAHMRKMRTANFLLPNHFSSF